MSRAVLQYKYLGLVIDCFLSWQDHIDYISSKISKSVNIITKLKRHVTKQSLVSIYYALVYPYLTYGCVLWGNNYEAPLAQLVKLQNKVVRVIKNVPLRDHITTASISNSSTFIKVTPYLLGYTNNYRPKLSQKLQIPQMVAILLSLKR